jgi:hypothetical protein
MRVKTFERLRNNISNAVQSTSMRSRFFVDRHAKQGEFKSGDLANSPYSKKWIPAFFLGGVTYGDSVRVQNYFTSATLPNEDVEWRIWKGKKTPFYTMGYAGFRRLTGRQTSHVDLTFSGQMLRNLTSRVRLSPNGFRVQVFVKEPFNDRMRWTNNRRKWLYLKDSEIDTIKEGFLRELTL